VFELVYEFKEPVLVSIALNLVLVLELNVFNELVEVWIAVKLLNVELLKELRLPVEVSIASILPFALDVYVFNAPLVDSSEFKRPLAEDVNVFSEPVEVSSEFSLLSALDV
jgi:hypothetical protein